MDGRRAAPCALVVGCARGGGGGGLVFYRYFSCSHPSARGYALSGAGRGARAGYAAFIFEGCSIFCSVANFPLEFTSKLNDGGPKYSTFLLSHAVQFRGKFQREIRDQ